VLLVVAAINLRGVVAGGRAFALPAVVFVGSLAILIVVGLARGAPLTPLPAASAVTSPRTVDILLLVAAFASGCSALTGMEAIANATPSFREPRRAPPGRGSGSCWARSSWVWPSAPGIPRRVPPG